MSNSFFSFCEDAFTSLGTVAIIIYYDSSGKISAYIYKPELRCLIKLSSISIASISSAKLNSEIKIPSLVSYINISDLS